MYEKYSGLPDTSKSSQSNSSRNGERPVRQTMYASGGNGSMEYYQAPKRGNGSGSSKRENARRAKIRKRRFILSLMSLLFLGLVVVAVVVLVKNCSGPAPQVDLETGKFRSGVSVNWTDVTGKTVDEVRPLLESNLNDTISKISITLASGELNATISGADLNLSSNLDEVLAQALSGGANQDYYSTFTVDEAALTARLNEINASTSAAPVDASFTVDFSSSGKPTFNYTEAGHRLQPVSNNSATDADDGPAVHYEGGSHGAYDADWQVYHNLRLQGYGGGHRRAAHGLYSEPCVQR